VLCEVLHKLFNIKTLSLNNLWKSDFWRHKYSSFHVSFVTFYLLLANRGFSTDLSSFLGDPITSPSYLSVSTMNPITSPSYLSVSTIFSIQQKKPYVRLFHDAHTTSQFDDN